MDLKIEDPRTADVASLLQRHLDFCHSVTPSENVFALDVEKLRRPGTTLFGARENGQLLGVCALKLLDPKHAELKSMHVLASSRGRGIGQSLINHVLEYAHAGGIERVSLETSPDEAFSSARRLYARKGFSYVNAFADYPENPTSVFMSIVL